MVQITQGGIVFGQPKAHWWDNVPSFDDFVGANGTSVDSAKWDTVLIAPSTSIAVAEIQSNQGSIRIEESDGTCSATMDLKTALNGGKLIAFITSITTSRYGDGYVYVGNAIDGWTTVINLALSDSAINAPTSVEAIYKGSNTWDVYVGNTKVQTGLTLANGFKIRFYCYGLNSLIGEKQISVENVVIQG